MVGEFWGWDGMILGLTVEGGAAGVLHRELGGLVRDTEQRPANHRKERL